MSLQSPVLDDIKIPDLTGTSPLPVRSAEKQPETTQETTPEDVVAGLTPTTDPVVTEPAMLLQTDPASSIAENKTLPFEEKLAEEEKLTEEEIALLQMQNTNEFAIVSTSAKQEEFENIAYISNLTFDYKLANRTDPYTYLEQNYKFLDKHTHISTILSNITKALFGCAPFIDKLRQPTNDPIALEFHKLINELIVYDDKRLYINSLSNTYEHLKQGMSSNIRKYGEYGNILNCLKSIWENTRYRKLFSIIRTISGYCPVCKNSGPEETIDIAPYVISKSNYIDPFYDMEDGLFAERVKERYRCTTCGTVTNYKVMITTSAPDIITVVPPLNIQMKNIKTIDIILPCEETQTHYYTLSSYIATKNDKTSVFVHKTQDELYTIDNGIDVDDDKIYDLLFYVKVGAIPNFRRVYE